MKNLVPKISTETIGTDLKRWEAGYFQSLFVNGQNIIPPPVLSVAGRTGDILLTKSDVNLGNVDNTSDVNKPVSSAQQTALNLKANLASPTFTGTPTAPTASGGTNTTQLSTTAFVREEIASLVASAPSTLDTLNELAVALDNDPNFATTITTLIGTKEPAIAAGTTSQYWRGDKSFRTLYQ
jgi:hypothetical protein